MANEVIVETSSLANGPSRRADGGKHGNMVLLERADTREQWTARKEPIQACGSHVCVTNYPWTKRYLVHDVL